LGRVVAADIVAAVDVPPAANSAMDGYAYCAADAAANKYRLALSQRIPAGAAPAPLEPGTVAPTLWPCKKIASTATAGSS
jgi:molybdopterin molybdotransferase